MDTWTVGEHTFATNYEASNRAWLFGGWLNDIHYYELYEDDTEENRRDFERKAIEAIERGQS